MFLDRVIFNKTKIPALNAVLDVTQLRQRVISNNIANVSTQGYRKQDLRFQEYLNSFVEKPQVAFTERWSHANVGGQILRNFALTFDQINHRIQLTRP